MLLALQTLFQVILVQHFDPTVGQIVSGMIEDPTTITAAQYGTIGQAVRGRIQDNVESGMPLNTAQNEAIDFFQPQAAVSTPITSEVTSGTSFVPVGMLGHLKVLV
jgi:hypothetical protein